MYLWPADKMFPNLTLFEMSRELQRPFDGLDQLHFNSSHVSDPWNISKEELDAFLAFLNHADAQHVNMTSFFDTYFSPPRFIVETAVAVIAGLFNILALIVVKLADMRHQPVLI